MKFFILTILALVALASSKAVQDKRGVVAEQQTYSASPAAALQYTKVQQPVQKTVVAAAQPQFYAQQQQPAAYSLPLQQQIQYQPQAQAVAYAQPTLAKYAAAAPAPAPAGFPVAAKIPQVAAAYRPQFSLANDVSSFTYSSPVVTYNNLGLLSQVVGRIANPGAQAKAVAAPAAPAAPAPAVYQAQAQPAPVSYAAPQKFAIPAAQPAHRFLTAAAPQQYLSQIQQQDYAAQPQAQAYQAQSTQALQAQAQAYSQAQAAQTVPQSFYSQAPQFYGAQQVKQQIGAGVAYAQ